jgi:hypothetical protein
MQSNVKDLIDEKDCDTKFIAFVDALAQLCKDHGVTLSTSGYDGLEVWDADSQHGPINCAGIKNFMNS